VAVVAESALNAKADVMIMSVGALMDQGLRTKLFELAKKNDCRIHIPSGAVAGLDGLKAAGRRLRSISLTTTKPPSGLQGAPYVLAHRIPLFALKERTTIFEGPAEEAVRAFPANVNVAATLSLVCGVPVHVRIVADPAIKVNMHEISAEGEFGRMTIKVENVPSPANPKTSYLAALSAFATIRGLAGCVMIGT
jgi:aspartate dehydrogenase